MSSLLPSFTVAAVVLLGARGLKRGEHQLRDGQGSPREPTTGSRRDHESFDEIAAEMALALAAGCRPLEALSRCTQHRSDQPAIRAQTALRRVRTGLDPLVALGELITQASSQSESAVYAALCGELRNGLAAAPGVSAIARAAAGEARTKEAERAARAAPLVQLVVALGLVPSALLIGAALLAAGLGGGR